MIGRLLDDPLRMRRIAAVLIVASLVEWAVAGFTGWVNSVAYVSHLSQLTFSISLVPWWQGLRVEARQVEEDIPNEVVEKLVAKTNVEPTGPSSGD